MGLERLKLAWENDLPEFPSNEELCVFSVEELRDEEMRSRSGMTFDEFERAGPDIKAELLRGANSMITLETVKGAPTRREVETWLRARDIMNESKDDTLVQNETKKGSQDSERIKER